MKRVDNVKIIHTSDWHIGKVVNEISMLEDQIHILDEIIDILNEEKPHVLVIAGDLYDRSVPPASAVEVLDGFLNKIVLELKIPIISIAGNHDSPERLAFASGMLKKQKFHMQGVLKDEIEKVTLRDEYGEVDFYLVPYADPAIVRHVYKDENIKSHDDAMKKIIEIIEEKMDKNKRNVLVTHGYVTFMGESSDENMALREAAIDEEGRKVRAGLEVSESERPLSIGGTDLISGKHFSSFNYVALGHLHGAQKVGSDRIRYAGSLLKYSFSEERQKKSVTIVDLNKDGEVNVALKSLNPIRDMRTIKGDLDYLTSPEFYEKLNKEDYIYALITDDGEVLDPMLKLRAVYPNVMGLRRESSRSLEEENLVRGNHKTKTKLELFEEFYENITLKTFDEERKEVISEVLEEVQRGGR